MSAKVVSTAALNGMSCRPWPDASVDVDVDVNFRVVGGFSLTVEVRDPENEITQE